MIKHLKQKQMYYSDPEHMEWRCVSSLGTWSEWNTEGSVWGTRREPDWGAAEYQIRRKQKRLVYTVDRPEPVREPLAGQEYYLLSSANRKLFIRIVWTGNDIDLKRLKRGLIYLTEKDVVAAARAMIGLEQEREE